MLVNVLAILIWFLEAAFAGSDSFWPADVIELSTIMLIVGSTVLSAMFGLLRPR